MAAAGAWSVGYLIVVHLEGPTAANFPSTTPRGPYCATRNASSRDIWSARVSRRPETALVSRRPETMESAHCVCTVPVRGRSTSPSPSSPGVQSCFILRALSLRPSADDDEICFSLSSDRTLVRAVPHAFMQGGVRHGWYRRRSHSYPLTHSLHKCRRSLPLNP